MVHPITGLPAFQDAVKSEAQLSCEAKGGTYDAASGTCNLPNQSVQQPSLPPPQPNTFDSQLGDAKLIADCQAKGGTWNPLDKVCNLPVPQSGSSSPSLEERQDLSRQNEGVVVDRQGNLIRQNRQELERNKDLIERIQAENTGIGAAGALRQQEFAAQGQELAGQVGDIDRSTGITPTDLSQQEAITVGIRDSIPRALTVAGGFALAGAAAGGGTPASIPLAVGAATIGFVGTISSSIISNFKSQRQDNTRAQQRVLDEGKQTLQDWATQAAADPSQRQFYVKNFNDQLQQIQDAHVQMLTDTNADVAKFETATTSLAEFNSFYSVGGERDALVADMQRSLGGGIQDLELNFRMMEMSQRRVPSSIPTQENTGGFLGELFP